MSNIGKANRITLMGRVTPRGADGKSAYELWLEAGNTGTEEDFLNSLKGYEVFTADTDGLVPKSGEITDRFLRSDGEWSSPEGSGDMLASVYDTEGKAEDIFAYADGLETSAKSYVDGKVLTDVPAGALFTDTKTTINGKTGAIEKADITALGIPEQDTTYSEATDTKAGLMSAGDKGKIDGIDENANDYTHPTHTAQSLALQKVQVDSLGHVTGVGAVEKADITNLGIPAQDTTYSTFVTDKSGLVPASGENTGKYLKGDGTWSTPPDTVTTINGKTGAITKEDITALGIPSQDTVTTINGQTGAITKADIVALGIPEQDTTYSAYDGTANGLVPKPTTASGKVLNDGGSWIDHRTIYTSKDEPTSGDGNDGDIWFVYEEV